MANIKVNIDVDSGDVQIASDKVLTLQQQIKVLRQELQKTPEGTKEFNALVTKLNDTQDAFSRVNIKGKELFGTLGLIPGPIGEIAARTNSAIDAIKVLGSFKASDIKAQFVALGADIKDVAATIGRLTGITAAYNLVARGTAIALNAVGVSATTASLGVRAFSAAIIATGIGALVVGIGFLVSKLMSLGDEAQNTRDRYAELDKEMQRVNDHADKRADAAFEITKERLKREGRNKEELLKLENTFLEAKIKISQKDDKIAEGKLIRDLFYAKDDAARKKVQEDFDIAEIKRKEDRNGYRVQIEKNLTAGYDAEQQKRETRNAKALQKQEQDTARIKALRDKELGELTSGRNEAYLELLTTQQAEEYKVTEQYVKLIDLAIKYGQDTTIFEAALVDKLKEIRDKAREEEKEKTDKAAKKRLEDERGILLAGLQAKIEALDRLNGLNEFDFEQDAIRLAEQKDILAEQQAIELQNEELNEFERTQIRDKYSKARIAIEDAETANTIAQAEFRRQVLMAQLDNAIQFGSLLQQVAGKNKALAISGVIIEKAASIAKIIASTAQGIAKLTPGLPFTAPAIVATKISGALGVVSTSVAAVKAISEINKAGSQAGVTGGGGASGGGSQALPAFSTPTIGAPQIGASASQQGQLAGIVAGALDRNNSEGRPIRAYVIGNDITSEQQLQRRIRTAARLGG